MTSDEESDEEDYTNDTYKKLNKEETKRMAEIQEACKSLPNPKARMTSMLEKLDNEMAKRREAIAERLKAAKRAKVSSRRKVALDRRKAAATAQLGAAAAGTVAAGQAGQPKEKAPPWTERCAAQPAYTFDSWEDGYETLKAARAYGFKLMPGISKSGAGSVRKEIATCGSKSVVLPWPLP